MTISEILHEHEWKRPHQKTDYAGGMTEADIDSIKSDSAALRADMEAKKNVTATTISTD
jgi:hypothetical protein